MGWTHYRLCFRLLSPLHVGHRPVGNLMPTRPYVPGKPLWAALTARLTRNQDRGAEPAAYREIGQSVWENFRFGYLWPSLDRDTPVFPWSPRWTQETFDFTFRGSYASTAITAKAKTGEEGLLHEVEYITPLTHDNYQVFIVGDLWVWEDGLRDDIGENWSSALASVQLGGERAYGWGRVERLTQFTKGKRDRGLTASGLHWREEHGEILVTPAESQKIPAHVLAVGKGLVSQGDVHGPMEALSGWERERDSSQGRTWRRAQVQLAYAPGAYAQQERHLQLGPWGLLTAPRSDIMGEAAE